MKGFKTTVDYRTKSTGDAAKDSALLAFGDHWRAVIQALEKQDATWPALAQTSAGPALAVQRDYVARDTKRKVGSTGVLRLFSSAANPVPARAGAPRSMTVVSCGNEREWLSLNLRTGKTLANDPEDNLNYETSATVTETSPGVWKVTAFGKTIYGSGRCA